MWSSGPLTRRNDLPGQGTWQAPYKVEEDFDRKLEERVAEPLGLSGGLKPPLRVFTSKIKIAEKQIAKLCESCLWELQSLHCQAWNCY